MNQVFENADHLTVCFTDESITFGGQETELCFPYGCITDLSLSLMGILQVSCYPQVCTFTPDRKDRSAMKEAVRFAREAMKTAPKAELRKVSRDAAAEQLSPEEQLKHYKMLFIQGAISKEEYDAHKQRLKH